MVTIIQAPINLKWKKNATKSGNTKNSALDVGCLLRSHRGVFPSLPRGNAPLYFSCTHRSEESALINFIHFLCSSFFYRFLPPTPTFGSGRQNAEKAPHVCTKIRKPSPCSRQDTLRLLLTEDHSSSSNKLWNTPADTMI